MAATPRSNPVIANNSTRCTPHRSMNRPTTGVITPAKINAIARPRDIVPRGQPLCSAIGFRKTPNVKSRTGPLPTTNEASPQTDESCIVPSHSGWRGSLHRRIPNDGQITALLAQSFLGSSRGHRPARHSPSDPASQTERRHRLKCSIRDCLREVSRLRTGCFVRIFQNLTHLHHVSFSQGL